MGGTVSPAAIDWHLEAERTSGATDPAIRAIGNLGAALSIVIGAVAIVGWSLDLPVLSRSRAVWEPVHGWQLAERS